MEAAATLAHARRRMIATTGIVLAVVIFFAIVANQALVASMLIAVFGTARDPVFPTPLLDLTPQHIAIVIVSSALTIAVGLPLGIWVTRESGRDFRDVVSAGVDFGQVFPPIAVLAVMFSAWGLGPAPAILALFLYGLFPVVSGTVAGLEAVPPEVIDAARGMGMGNWRILFVVELPLAMGVMLAGIRTSVIVNVGTATVAAATGAGGLGLPIFTGISTENIGYVVEGAVTVSVLALLFDGAIAVLAMWLAPESSLD
ncbi:MAG: osmoprotectant uptake system permease [Actinobacteria bacterium HGW-Actinobacteria-7]|nr:MAG: osmoprotectant uptake system permease [Actinobacteria bacterium HGW-Actinobacteria-7]